MTTDECSISPDMEKWIEKVKKTSELTYKDKNTLKGLKRWLGQEKLSCDLPKDVDKYNILRIVIEKINNLESSDVVQVIHTVSDSGIHEYECKGCGESFNYDEQDMCPCCLKTIDWGL